MMTTEAPVDGVPLGDTMRYTARLSLWRALLQLEGRFSA